MDDSLIPHSLVKGTKEPISNTGTVWCPMSLRSWRVKKAPEGCFPQSTSQHETILTGTLAQCQLAHYFQERVAFWFLQFQPLALSSHSLFPSTPLALPALYFCLGGSSSKCLLSPCLCLPNATHNQDSLNASSLGCLP